MELISISLLLKFLPFHCLKALHIKATRIQGLWVALRSEEQRNLFTPETWWSSCKSCSAEILVLADHDVSHVVCLGSIKADKLLVILIAWQRLEPGPPLSTAGGVTVALRLEQLENA